MLEAGRICFILITVFHCTSARSHKSIKLPLDILFNYGVRNNERSNKPMVIYLGQGLKETSSVNLLSSNEEYDEEQALEETSHEKIGVDDLLLTGNDGLIDDYYDGSNLEETAKHHAKMLFYNFLRTSPDENQDPTMEERKQILRQALRSRCQKIEMCVLTCSIQIPLCPQKCQIKYDEEDLCAPPKPLCKKPKCGRTMPPRWLL